MEHWDSVWKAQSDLFLWPTLRLWEFRKRPSPRCTGTRSAAAKTYWALLPDITVASDDAYFQMPLVQGLGFPGGETMIEPWVFMNWKRTYEYLYTAQTLSAAEALDVGLVNRVVARDDLDATVDELAAHVARAPLSTLMATKQLVKRAWELMGMRMPPLERCVARTPELDGQPGVVRHRGVARAHGQLPATTAGRSRRTRGPTSPRARSARRRRSATW